MGRFAQARQPSLTVTGYRTPIHTSLICWLQATERAAPEHAALAKDGTLRTLLSLFMPQLQLTAQTMKLQANAGEFSPVN